ncbi:MAG: hypothetical protein GFH27_549293n100 [Chloroflexi bacterium AL-W]|nr:hypothetical protein [Chloroflexi bacterium AL-N10]NOK82233.1 hypothetical protein [Chloroflexi bacterium AL-W]
MRLYPWQHYVQMLVVTLFAPLRSAQVPAGVQELRTQLHTQLLQIVVIAFLLICVPLDLITALFLWNQIWVRDLYPPIVLPQHIAHLSVLVGLVLLLLHRERPAAALTAIIVVKVLGVFGFIWLTGDAGGFLTLTFIFALPAIALPIRATFCIGLMVYLAFGGLVVVGPHIQTEALPALFLVTTSSLAFFTIIGYGCQRVLDRATLMLSEREREAVERAHIEARSRILEEYHQRLLSAQHDLRAPCNTAMRITQLLQDSTLDTATTHMFMKQLEPLLLCLRVRIDALMDEAKVLSTGTRHTLSMIDLTSTVQAYIPELQRWASISSSAQEMAPTTLHFRAAGSYCIRGREGEIQRILENLVLNSVAAGAQSIHIAICQSASSDVELIIEDDGAGFPPWLLERSLHLAVDYRAHGIGLGLVGISANVAAFQGSISLDNWRSGARVRICFPRVESMPDIRVRHYAASR